MIRQVINNFRHLGTTPQVPAAFSHKFTQSKTNCRLNRITLINILQPFGDNHRRFTEYERIEVVQITIEILLANKEQLQKVVLKTVEKLKKL